MALGFINEDDDKYLMIGHFGSDGKYYMQAAEFLKSNNLSIPSNWDLQVRWGYLKMGSHSIVDDNNLGIVVADSASASHALLGAAGQSFSTTVKWTDILQFVPTPVTSLP